MVVSSQRLFVFSPRKNEPDLELELNSLEAVAENLVGEMALVAELDGRKVELLRCSDSLSSRFNRMAKSLNEARKEDKQPEFDLEEEEERVCPTCGRLLPERGSFCPAWLKKTKVLARFWKYIKPHWRRLTLVSVLIMVGTGMNLVPPYLVKILVDDVLQGEGGTGLLLSLGMSLVGLGITRGRLTAWLGARLSGGEKQRISIARAILHGPNFLILGEATSLVDTETEELIQEALTRLIKDMTTFDIAHRLSTLKNASRLLVIEDGKKAEFGTHEELLAKEGTYHKLVNIQSKLSGIKAVDG